MALNNELDSVLRNVANGVSPVIRLSNGLYTLVDKSSIIPDETLGTNLIGYITDDCYTNDQIIRMFRLLGTWPGLNYIYNSETNKWSYITEEM